MAQPGTQAQSSPPTRWAEGKTPQTLRDAAPNFAGPITGKTGQGLPANAGAGCGALVDQGPAAFKTPPTPLAVGPSAYSGPYRLLKFITPIVLSDLAAQTVNLLFFKRPMPIQQAPNSNPILKPQPGFPQPPINANRMAAGRLNLQEQLGNISIQAARLQGQDEYNTNF